MNKNLLAFFLSCFTVAVLFSCLVLVLPEPNQRQVRVEIHSDSDTHDIVAAVNALHRTDVDVTTSKAHRDLTYLPLTIPFATLLFMINTGIILFFYKFYARRLGAAPTV
jgi:hypothetical protein